MFIRLEDYIGRELFPSCTEHTPYLISLHFKCTERGGMMHFSLIDMCCDLPAITCNRTALFYLIAGAFIQFMWLTPDTRNTFT